MRYCCRVQKKIRPRSYAPFFEWIKLSSFFDNFKIIIFPLNPLKKEWNVTSEILILKILRGHPTPSPLKHAQLKLPASQNSRCYTDEKCMKKQDRNEVHYDSLDPLLSAWSQSFRAFDPQSHDFRIFHSWSYFSATIPDPYTSLRTWRNVFHLIKLKKCFIKNSDS